MAYFLAKTEPGAYSIDDLERDGETVWDGVKNAAALLAIRAMQPGDIVLIYHSGGESAIVGTAEVISEPRPTNRCRRVGWWICVIAGGSRRRSRCAR